MRKRELEDALQQAKQALEQAEDRVADLTALLVDGVYDDEQPN